MPAGFECSLRSGLEDLNGIARGILNQDLRSTRTLDDLAAERRLAPRAGRRSRPGRRRGAETDSSRLARAFLLPSRRLRPRLVQQQSQIVPGQSRRAWRARQFDAEPEILAIELDGYLNVVHELWGDLRELLAADIRAIQQSGELGAWVNPDVMAAVLVAVANGFVVQAIVEPDGPTLPALATQFGSLMLAARKSR
jgi:BetI-type transcriptional repressor, C-terminal